MNETGKETGSPDVNVLEGGRASWMGYLLISVIALAVTIVSGWSRFQEWLNFLK